MYHNVPVFVIIYLQILALEHMQWIRRWYNKILLTYLLTNLQMHKQLRNLLRTRQQQMTITEHRGQCQRPSGISETGG